MVRYALPLLPLAMIVIPVHKVALRRRRSRSTSSIACCYFLLVTGLVLGSFVVKQVSHGNYPLALAQS